MTGYPFPDFPRGSPRASKTALGRADAICAIFLATLLSVDFIAAGQDAQGTEIATVTLDVVNSFGQPLRFMTIHIDGVDYRQVAVHRLVKYQGRASFSLPRGTYRFSCDSTGATWPMERTLDILGRQAYVLLAVARRESWLISGEGSRPTYTVEGTVVEKRERKQALFARIRGIYLSTAAEAQIDASGHFAVTVPFQGDYDVELVGEGTVLAHKPVRFDESTSERLSLHFAIP